MAKLLAGLFLLIGMAWGQYAGPTRNVRAGTSLPATCTSGGSASDIFIKTNATSSQEVYVCTAANTWTQQGGSASGVTASGTLTSTALITGAGTTVVQAPSATSTLDGSGNASFAGTVTSGAGSGATGQVKLTGATSAATSIVTVDATNTATTLKLPNDATSGLYVASATSGTPSSGCAQFNGTGTELASTGASCSTPASTESHTATNAATHLDFTTCLNSGSYDTYTIVIEHLQVETSGADIWIRFSTNGGMSYDSGSSYSWTTWVFRAGPASAAAGSAGDTKIQLTNNGLISTGSRGLSAVLNFDNSFSGTSFPQIHGTEFYRDNEPQDLGSVATGAYNSATAVNAFQVLSSNSAKLATGTVKCYAVPR